MSTTLTNGVIIPDNGSRNWGGDLANNWNILDVHVGYMTDVKNKVTTLENSVTTLETNVAENTANIQINTSNISTLQTSKQDVIEDLETIRSGASAGATAVQPSALNNYVDLSSEQTIGGIKTFTDRMLLKSSTFERGDLPSTNITEDREIEIVDRNNRRILGIFNYYYTTGSGRTSFYAYNPNTTDYDNISLAFNFDNTTNNKQKSLMPVVTNAVNLGTSSNKWKSINGINPGALSLPNCGEDVDVTSQVVNTDGVFQYTNNFYDGWLVITAFADNGRTTNQGFEYRGVKSFDDAVTINMALRLNETTYMNFTNFKNFAYVKLYKCVANV